MLYLLQAADPAGVEPLERVPVAELTALGLERALLAQDRTARECELATALARDPAVTAWAIRAAQLHSESVVNNTEQAIASLGGSLAIQLARSLASKEQRAGANLAEIEFRLPALAARLADYERQVADFNTRLEYEKLEAMKELAYGAGHEINNPLANIAARAQTLLQDEADPERARKLAAIHRQAMRAHEMIADLMLFARPPKLNLATCDARQIARSVVDELADIAAEQDTQLAFGADDASVEIEADRTQLGVALQALVTNALEAVGEGGHVRVAVRKVETENESLAELSVRDDGPGISDKVRQRMFDPFFSGREAGRGLGFGLSKCWRIVTDHGGRIIVEPPAGGGAEITIVLKVAGTLRVP
ncbi:MAG TPA: HAMP domain-containing sensor histidine kinase [Lacipirellulaceae bacterium]|nr:HAMP domain-containing sensor histidine kinase [Lacipirellulaceae bacterium]